MINEFLKADWQSHKIRLCAEALGMLLSLLVAVIIMTFTPHPPMVLCYVLWELASILLVGSAVSRGSVGLTLLYGGFLVIDTVGLIRTLLA